MEEYYEVIKTIIMWKSNLKSFTTVLGEKSRKPNETWSREGSKQRRMGFPRDRSEFELPLRQSLAGKVGLVFLVSLGRGFIYKIGINMPATQLRD